MNAPSQKKDNQSFKTKRICAGAYEVIGEGYTVTVDRFDFGSAKGEWIARAEWVGDLYTDPLPTMRDAIANAREMIREQVVS